MTLSSPDTSTPPPGSPAERAAAGAQDAAVDDEASRPSSPSGGMSGHRRQVLVVEAVVLAAVIGFAAWEAPGFASSMAGGFERLSHPDLYDLAAAAALEALSLLSLAAVPRWLLARCSVPLSWHDAVTLTLAANGMAVVLPAGTVTSSVWVAHQYSRRGARAAVATWVVLAAGFASSVTVILLALVGAMVAGVADEALLAVVTVVFVVGTGAFVWLTHRAEGINPAAPAAGEALVGRVLRRLARLIGDSAGQRAGWSTGAAVLGASAVNWLADAAVLASTFGLLRMQVPWRGVLLAYAAGQVAGALVPLPGGLGAVEGGMVGVLVALGVATGPAVAVVAVYRLIGYWGPTMASVPAYGWARRHLERTLPPGRLHPPDGSGAPA